MYSKYYVLIQLKQHVSTCQLLLMYSARNIISDVYKNYISYYEHVQNLFCKSAVCYLRFLTDT